MLAGFGLGGFGCRPIVVVLRLVRRCSTVAFV